MSGLVIIGGSKGIGNSILQKSLNTRVIHNISRSHVSGPQLTHHSLDILYDELPTLEASLA